MRMAVLSPSRLENVIPLYVKVNGTAEKFHGIPNQGLVLGVAYTGRIGRAAAMLGKGGEIIVDDRLVGRSV